MADITVTAANIAVDASATVIDGTAGEAVNQGQIVYADSTASDKLKKASDASATVAAVKGIAVTTAAANGQPVKYITKGNIDFGAGVLEQGKIYVAGAAAGGIKPMDDLGSGDYTCVVGLAVDTSTLKVSIIQGGVAIT